MKGQSKGSQKAPSLKISAYLDLVSTESGEWDISLSAQSYISTFLRSDAFYSENLTVLTTCCCSLHTSLLWQHGTTVKHIPTLYHHIVFLLHFHHITDALSR